MFGHKRETNNANAEYALCVSLEKYHTVYPHQVC